MQIKVCGLKHNIAEIANIKNIDYLGFIFYKLSTRCINDNQLHQILSVSQEKKVAVYVDEDCQTIERTCEMYRINTIQLHGDETPEFCFNLKEKGFNVIKAFAIDDNFDFNALKAYTTVCNYFLFDTKGPLKGGNGKKFSWSVLEKYALNTPFFLSGGIELSDVENIKTFRHPMFYGIDVNSGFETSPGNKNEALIKIFIKHVKN